MAEKDDEEQGLRSVALQNAQSILLARRRAEEELRKQTEWLRVTLASIGDAVISTDAQGRVTFINAVAESLTGWPQAEALGRPLTDVFRIINEATRQPAENPVEKVLKLGQIAGLANHTLLIAKDGVERPIDDSAAPIRDEQGRVAGCVLIFRDITERKRLEDLEREGQQRLRQLAADLSEADRRKNEFLAMLAHELRNPLAPIRHAVQTLRLSGGSSPVVAEATEMMERQVGQMARLVDDLLDVSRITRGKIEIRKERIELAFAVNQAVEAARSFVQCMAHNLTVTLPPQPIYLHADPTRLTQVIGNLLNNACKFTDQGGRIELVVSVEGRVASEERPPAAQSTSGLAQSNDAGLAPIDVRRNRSDAVGASEGAGSEALKLATRHSPLATSFAVIRVRDTGIGIAAEQLPRIFDMFMQVDTSLERSTSGLGIGLTLVKNLVEMHDGAVEIHSAGVGQGSEVVVRLPIASGVLALDQEASPEPPVGAATPARRILVVDDNRDAAKSLAMLLQLAGNELHVAFNGLEAVEAAATFRPDVVLLDIGLPKLNGYEAARRIRAQPWSKDTLLVALTGWGGQADREKSKDAGFDAHLVKPVDLAALTKLLASAIPAP